MRNNPTPIIIPTAKSEESDILPGLELGADDYLKKPFSIKKLKARVEAILRRSSRTGGITANGEPDGSFSFGEFQLDRFSHKLRRQDGTPVKLPPKEYDLLAFLTEHSGEALSRQRIMDCVWEYDSQVTFGVLIAL